MKRYAITGIACDSNTLLRVAGVRVAGWSALREAADAIDDDRRQQRTQRTQRRIAVARVRAVARPWSMPFLRIAVALVAMVSALPAVDWSAYDKQLHFTAGALGSYVLADVLEDTTDLRPWQRWLISAATLTAAGWAFEELNGSGYRDASDAIATQFGAVIGATAQVGLGFVFHRDGAEVSVAWRF